MFTHLHVHSHYSFLDGASSPEALCEYAKELGYQALALTDTNGLYGAVAFWQAAQEAGLRPIFGAELTSSLPPQISEPSAIVLAKDNQGFSELCQLITARHLDQHFDLAKALSQSSRHVAVITSHLFLGQKIASQRQGQNTYLEIADLSQPGQPGALALAVQQAAAAHVPVVATNAVHFARPAEHSVHCALRAIHYHTSLHDLPAGAAHPAQAYLRSPQEMQQCFQHLPAVLTRAECLADECCGTPPLGHYHVTAYPCPPNETEFSYLSKICFIGLRHCYPARQPEARQQLKRELAVIARRNFSGYFLVVWDIAQEAKRRHIPTVGRGSAANSIVSYCLGITQVDPLRHGLFFERFLNPEREDPPDIDLDFPWDQRDQMLQYAFARFGPEKVAMICTIIRLQARSAVREAGRLLGLTEKEISAFCRKLPYFGSVADIALAQQQIPESRDLPWQEEPWRTVLALAAKLDGAPRHLSVHPGGIVIASEPVAYFMPKEMASKGVEVTQYDMHATEDSGFVKIDLLGQRGLAVIRDAAQAVGVDWSRLDPTQDAATKRLLREGQTLGCFYVESPAMRQLLRKLKCDDFELLTAASSIIRPGVSNSGMMRMFVERHLGRQAVRFAHPRLKPLLQQTYGVMVYQEDVIKVVHAVAGMSLAEADKLRQCMSKKRQGKKMDTYQQRFFSGAQQQGVSGPAAQEIWRQIEAFGGYAFCKAHSASYAQLSFQAAYLKAHYPVEFMAAVLSNQGGFYSAAAYLEEARRLGIPLLLPSVNASQWQYTKEGNSLRVGLLAVRHLSYAQAEMLVQERERHHAYVTLRDLVVRTSLCREALVALIAAGACDELGKTRCQLMWELMLMASPCQRKQQLELALVNTALAPPLLAWNQDEQLAAEYQQLKLSPRAHPLMFFRQSLSALARHGYVAAADLARHAGQRVRVYGWRVTWRPTRVHATGEMMKFITLEDFTGLLEVTLFPSVYRQYGPELHGHGPYLVAGWVEDNCGSLTITAEWIKNLGCAEQSTDQCDPP